MHFIVLRNFILYCNIQLGNLPRCKSFAVFSIYKTYKNFLTLRNYRGFRNYTLQVYGHDSIKHKKLGSFAHHWKLIYEIIFALRLRVYYFVTRKILKHLNLSEKNIFLIKQCFYKYFNDLLKNSGQKVLLINESHLNRVKKVEDNNFRSSVNLLTLGGLLSALQTKGLV